MWVQAESYYSQAIEIKETAVLLSNRAFSYIKHECFGAAIEDAKRALELDKNYVKAYMICNSLL